MKIDKVWQDRIDSGTFTKGECQQFTNYIARAAEGLQTYGRRTNLTGDQCCDLLRKLVERGGVRLTSTHSDQGLTWLRKYGHKIFGAELAADIVANFSHFLYLGDIRTYGQWRNGTLPVWRIVLTDGRIYDYWNAAWQGQEMASGYEAIPVRPTMGGDCLLMFERHDDGILWFRCTVHSTPDHDELVMGTDVYCEKA